MISYEPFWKTISEKGITTYTLIYKYHVSSSLIDKLKHNKGVNVTTLDSLCIILECDIADLVKHVAADQ